MLEGGVLDGALVLMDLVAGSDDGTELGADFALTRGGLVVVARPRDPSPSYWW